MSGGLTLSGATLNFDLGTNGSGTTVTDKLTSVGTPAVSGSNIIDIVGFGAASLTPGTYNLITGTTGSALGVAANFTLGTGSVTVNGRNFNLSLGTTSGTAEQLVVSSAIVVNGSWTQTATSSISSPASWGTVTNWSGSNSSSVPGIAGDTATFGSATTKIQYINLDQNRSVGAITFNNSLATSTTGLYTIAGNGFTLTLDSTGSAATITNTTGNNTISAPIALNDASNITMTAGTLTLSGIISDGTGSNGLTLSSGSGTVIVSGTNTYSGGTTINTGMLQLGSTGALPSGGVVTVGGGTLNLNSFNQSVGAVSISSGSIGGGILTGTGFTASGGTVNANLAGSALGQASGFAVLSGSNGYSGGTNLTGGTLQLNSTTALPSGQAVSVSGGTLNLNGNSQNIAAGSVSISAV